MNEQPLLVRPHLQVAVFCEKHLQEADGVLSLIRIVDRFTINGATPQLQPTILNFTTVVIFKSGFLRGNFTLRLRPLSPSKNELPSINFPVLFEGDEDRGLNVILPTQFLVEEEGVYWFRVYVENDEITRMPLRVIYRQQPYPSSGMGNSD